MTTRPDLCSARERAGLSLEEVADRAGVVIEMARAAEADVDDVPHGVVRRLFEAASHELVATPVGDAVIDADDRSMMSLALSQTPEARLRSFENLLALRRRTA